MIALPVPPHTIMEKSEEKDKKVCVRKQARLSSAPAQLNDRYEAPVRGYLSILQPAGQKPSPVSFDHSHEATSYAHHMAAVRACGQSNVQVLPPCIAVLVL